MKQLQPGVHGLKATVRTLEWFRATKGVVLSDPHFNTVTPAFVWETRVEVGAHLLQ